MTTDPNQLCAKCGKPFYWAPNRTTAVPDTCRCSEIYVTTNEMTVKAYKERLKEKILAEINAGNDALRDTPVMSKATETRLTIKIEVLNTLLKTIDETS